MCPARIEFVVGTQTNGAPHLGTNIVQTSAFLLAQEARQAFGVPTAVRFSVLDNASHETTLERQTGHVFQRTGFHALGEDGIAVLIEDYYRPLFTALSLATDIEWTTQTYTRQQATPAFRVEFLRTLEAWDDLRWWLAPSTGDVPIRLPCPDCGWAEQDAQRTQLLHRQEDQAVFQAVCLHHGGYEAVIDSVDGGYLDLTSLHRNVVKERDLSRDTSALHVMVKGSDWAYASPLVDGALAAMGAPASVMPTRIFTPLVVSTTGAHLSKSLNRALGPGRAYPDVEPWMLSTADWPGSMDQYADTLIELVGRLLADPTHFFRSYSATELGHLAGSLPVKPTRA